MGRVKSEWMESQQRGYSLPSVGEKFLCCDHFEDKYLRKYISDNSNNGSCSYCNNKTKVIDLQVFVTFIAEMIYKSFSNPDYEDLYLASSFYDDNDDVIPGAQRIGNYIAPEHAKHFSSTTELFYQIDLISDNKRLNREIEDCFLNDDWIQRNPYMMTVEQELSLMWNLFSRMVMHEQRFTFFKRPEFLGNKLNHDNDLLDILTELSNIISQHNLSRILPTGTVLYRCREEKSGELIESFGDITSPPNLKAKQSRMSPAGISMFYGAFDQETAIIETDCIGKSKKLGKFSLIKDLVVIDLTMLPQFSFWMPGDKEGIGFLHSFSLEISKPIQNDFVHIEYVPSQVFTEYLRYIYNTIDNCKLDGIIYNSSLKGAKKNIVLFYDQESSKEVLGLKSFEIDLNQC